LGGGLATAAALATGNKAIVFDAAGVSKGTIAHIKATIDRVDIESNEKEIINFNVRECFVSDPNTPLGRIQHMVGTRQYGRQYWLQSVSARANFILLPDWTRTVKTAESVLNHAWHVYTFQLQRKNFESNEPLTDPADASGPEPAKRVSATTAETADTPAKPPSKKQKVSPDEKED